MNRRLLVPALAAAVGVVLGLGGCTATEEDSDEPVLTAAELAFQDDLAAIDGVSSATVGTRVGQVTIGLVVDPSATDAEKLADAVAGSFAASDFARRALHVEFNSGDGRDFEWNGYDPADHERAAAALGIWWRVLGEPHGVSELGGMVAGDWFGFHLDADPHALLAGTSTVAALAAVRAEAEAAGLTILESDFSVELPFGQEQYLELEPDALRHTPSSTTDLLDGVSKPAGVAVYLVGLRMDVVADDTSVSEHEIPTEIYIIPTELPGGGYPPFDPAFAQTAVDALQVGSFTQAVRDGARIDGIYLLTDTGLVRVNE